MPTPYYTDEHVTLYHGDWRELIPPTLQADLIVTDPPYGETSLDWDVWPTGWPTQAAQHTKSMWCFGSTRMFLDRRQEFTGWKMSQDIVWEKHNGSGFHADRFKRVHEIAIHWYRGDWAAIRHETPRTGPERRPQRFRRANTPHLGNTGSAGVITGRPLARSVLYAPSMHGQAINETEKPVTVLEPMIQYGCPPGGLVLDLYAGSASTLIAARNTGRRAIGYETREHQCEQAARRLAQDTLFTAGATE